MKLWQLWKNCNWMDPRSLPSFNGQHTNTQFTTGTARFGITLYFTNVSYLFWGLYCTNFRKHPQMSLSSSTLYTSTFKMKCSNWFVIHPYRKLPYLDVTIQKISWPTWTNDHTRTDLSQMGGKWTRTPTGKAHSCSPGHTRYTPSQKGRLLPQGVLIHIGSGTLIIKVLIVVHLLFTRCVLKFNISELVVHSVNNTAVTDMLCYMYYVVQSFCYSCVF